MGARREICFLFIGQPFAGLTGFLSRRGPARVSRARGVTSSPADRLRPRRRPLQRQADSGRDTLKHIVIMTALLGFAAVANAAGATCTVTAGEKKLAGAAKNSFMKKCETDAKTTCDAQAAEKKLAGAAKNSFTKKCVADAVGG